MPADFPPAIAELTARIVRDTAEIRSRLARVKRRVNSPRYSGRRFQELERELLRIEALCDQREARSETLDQLVADATKHLENGGSFNGRDDQDHAD